MPCLITRDVTFTAYSKPMVVCALNTSENAPVCNVGATPISYIKISHLQKQNPQTLQQKDRIIKEMQHR